MIPPNNTTPQSDLLRDIVAVPGQLWVPRRKVVFVDGPVIGRERRITATVKPSTVKPNLVLSGPAGGAAASPTYRIIRLRSGDVGDVAISSPTANQVLTYDGTVWRNKPASALSSSPFLTKMIRYWVMALNNTIANTGIGYGFGFANWINTGATNANVGADGTNPSAVQLGTGTGANAQAHWQADNGGDVAIPFCYGTNVQVCLKFLPAVAHTNARYWLGWYDNQSVPPTQFKATTPTGVIAAAFRYDDSADTSWKAVYVKAGTATVVDTGVAYASTGTAPEFLISWDGTTFTYKINGTVVATIAPSTSPAPPLTTTLCNPFVSMDNSLTAGAAIKGNLYYVYQEEG